jgi:NAD(P)-dependent dehydrogenase (short-subunit alcohol dehydrogenase family)
VIIVSGGAKGIGEGIVKLLSKKGAIPVIAGHHENDNLKTVAAIEAAGGSSFQVVAELSRPEDCENAIRSSLQNGFSHLSIYGLLAHSILSNDCLLKKFMLRLLLVD